MSTPRLPLLCLGLAIICCILTCSSSSRAAEPAAAQLVIVSAVYGDLDDDKTADVTAKVAAMVKDNSLSVVANSENFGEPAPGKPKKLKVGYTIEGVYRSKTVDQGETLDISTRLVILKAVYGDLVGGKTGDVTDQVADLVRKNKLSVKADNETFGDTAEGTVKRLRVDYLIDGVRKSQTVAENDTLTIGE